MTALASFFVSIRATIEGLTVFPLDLQRTVLVVQDCFDLAGSSLYDCNVVKPNLFL